MGTILIQKGNSITATVAVDMTRERGVYVTTRSETRLRFFKAN
jgi:hypothetical protein